MLFTRELTKILGGEIVFLYGGSDCDMGIEEISEILQAELLYRLNEAEATAFDSIFAHANFQEKDLTPYFEQDVRRYLAWRKNKRQETEKYIYPKSG